MNELQVGSPVRLVCLQFWLPAQTSMVASAGETNRDLAVTQFTKNLRLPKLRRIPY
jgi:hypothetical protein